MRNPTWDRAMHDVRQLTAAARRTFCSAYQFWDGFDNYGVSTELWDSQLGLSAPGYSSAYVRFVAPSGTLGQGMKCTGAYKQKNLLSNQATMIFGFAVFLPVLGGDLLEGFDGGTKQWSLYVNSSGAFQHYRGDIGGTLLATSAPGVFTANTWHWLDIVVTCSNTVGSISVYLDSTAGAPAIFTASGLNNRSSANSYINAIRLGDMSNVFAGAMFDDFHCHDSSGSAPNAVLGDSRIYTKKPNAAGYATNWTPNGASSNWQCVDDSPPDGDTTYNSSNTAGAIDGYAVPTAGFTVAPHGLVRRSYVRRDDAGPHTFQNGIRSSGTNGLGTAFTVPSTYAWTDGATCYVNDPSTGSPWANAAAADAASMVIDETS